VSFTRSNLAVHWGSAFHSLLELAEACDVPVRWSCRTGVCHNCETGLVSGSVTYRPDPVEPPAAGNLLICYSQPKMTLLSIFDAVETGFSGKEPSEAGSIAQRRPDLDTAA
jgi:ferredoxin